MIEQGEYPLLTQYQQRVDRVLEEALPTCPIGAETLCQAMSYMLLAKAKRLRPALVYATAKTLGIALQQVDKAAAAVEIVHTYSLIHDDLPAMDDDDLRRGQPSCHIAFDEATAVLAGDALQTLAFELLTEAHPHLEPQKQLKMLRHLAIACSCRGMAGGQAMDLNATGTQPTLEHLEQIHRHKTGALIQACIELGRAPTNFATTLEESWRIVASELGLAFQIQDDLLDIQATTEQLGKPQGADASANKTTYPSIIGVAATEKLIQQKYQLCLQTLKKMRLPSDELSQIITLMAQRQY